MKMSYANVADFTTEAEFVLSNEKWWADSIPHFTHSIFDESSALTLNV